MLTGALLRLDAALSATASRLGRACIYDGVDILTSTRLTQVSAQHSAQRPHPAQEFRRDVQRALRGVCVCATQMLLCGMQSEGEAPAERLPASCTLHVLASVLTFQR